MNEQEAKQFYQKQSELSEAVIDFSAVPDEHVNEMIEQVGRKFSTILELGAGNGALARGFSPYAKAITTVELVPKMVNYAKSFETANITSILGSFYEVELPKQYDLILYIDGFGVGTDSDQLDLLKRIYHWLNDEGVALIDIYHPNYWKKINGEKMTPYAGSNITRVYGYDETNKQMTDTWWHDDKSDDKYTQILACYSLDEIYELCKKAKLKIIAYYPGGAMDFENWVYHENVPLTESLSYRIKVVKE